MRSFTYITNVNITLYKSIIFGVLVSVCLIATLLCVIALFFVSSSLPPFEYIEYAMLAVDAISVFFGGYVAARINKQKGLIIGAGVGAIVLVSVLISGLSISYTTPTLLTLFKIITIPLMSALGGVKGVNKKEKIRIK